MKFIYLLTVLIFLQSCEKKKLSENEILEKIHSQEKYKDLQFKTDFTYGYDFIDSIKTFKETVRRENFKPIYEADFNNDGKLDYLVNLRYAETEKDDIIKVFFDEDFFNSFLLLSSTEDYQLLNLGEGKVYDIVGAKIISHKNKNLIQLLSFKTSIVNKDDILKSDTLMIKNNQLTEFTESTNQHKIEKIIFTQIGGYAPGTEYQLTIKRDSIILQSGYFKNLKGTYFGITDSGFEHLSHYLNDINFNKLQDHFCTECNDCPAIQTQIIFNNGKVKTIHDYGERGTLGLVKFYEKIDYLMKHQKWIKIK